MAYSSTPGGESSGSSIWSHSTFHDYSSPSSFRQHQFHNHQGVSPATTPDSTHDRARVAFMSHPNITADPCAKASESDVAGIGTLIPQTAASSPGIQRQLRMIFDQRAGVNTPLFHPSHSIGGPWRIQVDQLGGIFPNIPPATPLTNRAAVVSNGNYQGRTTAATNQNPLISDTNNCAVWIERLPTQATLKDLLDQIRNTGKVYTTFLNPASGGHLTSAAKLVFFSPTAAQIFLTRANSITGIRVLGRRVNARYNRHKYQAHAKIWESRVIHIKGPVKYANAEFMKGFIGSMVRADILEIFVLRGTFVDKLRGVQTLEIQFGSLLAQAAAIKRAVELEPAFMDVMEVTWGVDPCE